LDAERHVLRRLRRLPADLLPGDRHRRQIEGRAPSAGVRDRRRDRPRSPCADCVENPPRVKRLTDPAKGKRSCCYQEPPPCGCVGRRGGICPSASRVSTAEAERVPIRDRLLTWALVTTLLPNVAVKLWPPLRNRPKASLRSAALTRSCAGW